MFAFFTASGRGAGDALLSEVAKTLEERGVQVRGVVQCNFEYDPARRCQMDLQVLGSDKLVRISQDRGIHAKGCRLDTQGLAEAVFHVETALKEDGTDLLIINKFGKQECDGEGFRDVIGHALAEDVPVLTSCGPGHRDGLLEFSGGMATELPADLAQIVEWCLAQTALARLP
jgi:nucleoside-triphosphatase THEP1